MSGTLSATEIAEQAGIDLALSLDNLRPSYDGRPRRLQSALDLALALKAAGNAVRERSAKDLSVAKELRALRQQTPGV